jgi:anti-sigma-K factor RskA
MRISNNSLLDALCGEYLIGTLRGAARRRFERALRDEPLARSRLEAWQRFAPVPAKSIQPSPSVWRRLERTLDLGRARRGRRFWMGWAGAAVAALVIAVGVQLARERPLELAQVAELSGKDAATVGAFASRDRRTLILRAARPTSAPANQSFELWLIPAEGGAPLSVAVLTRLDARLNIPDAHVERLRIGATLAISTEPAGGSPTGEPTGPVILAGRISG